MLLRAARHSSRAAGACLFAPCTSGGSSCPAIQTPNPPARHPPLPLRALQGYASFLSPGVKLHKLCGTCSYVAPVSRRALGRVGARWDPRPPGALA